MNRFILYLLLAGIFGACGNSSKIQAEKKKQDSIDKAVQTKRYYDNKEKERLRNIELNNKEPEKKKNMSKAKITRIEYKENKTNNYKIRWITYYVANFTNDDGTYKKMEEVAFDIVKNDLKETTNIFFFKNKSNIPPLDKQGKGWAAGYSQNQFNSLYGKDCVGWYYKEKGTYGELSKGWY
jgi:hypothetical protein